MEENINAILIDARDDVATLAAAAEAGQRVSFSRNGECCLLTAAEAIPIYHKIAVRPIAAGAKVYKYGEFIGHALCDIPAGAWVHTHNLA